MIAHKVIDDLMKFSDLAAHHESRNMMCAWAHEYFPSLCEDIRSAKKLLIDDNEEFTKFLLETFKHMTQADTLTNDFGGRFPIERCFIEFIDKKNRWDRCLLVEKIGEDRCIIRPIGRQKIDRTFFVEDPVVVCTIGKKKDLTPEEARGIIFEKGISPKRLFAATGPPESLFLFLPLSALAGKMYLTEGEVKLHARDMMSRVASINELLTCKNIELSDVAPRKRLKPKNRKKRRTPEFSYKTITVVPTSEKEKSIPRKLWENRLHFCRGHFQTFTKEKPRFGIKHPNHIGKFWVQPHMRGNKDIGRIESDYKLGPKMYNPSIHPVEIQQIFLGDDEP